MSRLHYSKLIIFLTYRGNGIKSDLINGYENLVSLNFVS